MREVPFVWASAVLKKMEQKLQGWRDPGKINDISMGVLPSLDDLLEH